MRPPVLALFLFLFGLLGICFRKNMLTLLLCFELMLNGVSLLFVYFGQGNVQGQVLVLFVILFAACEVAIGLSLVLYASRCKETDSVDAFSELKW